MKRNFRYRFEPFKGYIPFDTLRVAGRLYSHTSRADLHGMVALSKAVHGWARKSTLVCQRVYVLSRLHEMASAYLRRFPTASLYFNVNHDGIDCFVIH